MTAKKPKDTPRRQRADWQAIERDYRTGKFTDQELADKHNNVVTRQAISKRAKEKKWQKDLTDAVRRATNAKLIGDLAEKKVAEQVAEGVAKSCQDATDSVLIAAEVNKQVILKHRGDIKETSDLAMEMLGELRMATQSKADLGELLRMAKEGISDLDAKALADALADLTRVHSRVSSVHKLADTLTKLQTMERKAFGLGDDGDGAPPSAIEPVFNITLTSDKE